MSTEDSPYLVAQKPRVARTIRKTSVLVILAWLALTLTVTFAVPWLETVGRQHSVPLAAQDAPTVKAMERIGRNFRESDSDSFAMLVLEGQQQLGDETHPFYDSLIAKLRSDKKHVENVQDLWSDRLTAVGAQSSDGKAVYAQMILAGDQGTTLGQDSVAAVRQIVANTPAPPGIKVYLTGPAALVADVQHSGDRSILKMTLIGAVIIFLVLLFVYRSVVTVFALLATVAIELFAARGIVAFLADHEVFVLSTFSINLLVALAMAAGTDYGIFFFGRYQEARQAGEDLEAAYYSTYRGVAPVVLGSGLTIAGAMVCLSFTRLPIFQTIGVPCGIGMLIAVAVALTLVPAVLTVGSRFGLFEPNRAIGFRRWRRLGTAIVRWPAPILVATLAVAMIALVPLTGYQTNYNDRLYIPKDIPASVGYTAAERHFSASRMMPEILMIESDHDMRNPADFLVLHKLAKAIFKVPGISRVQGITRPEGTPIQHTSIPFLISLQNAGMMQSMKFMRNQIDMMKDTTNLMAKQITLMKRLDEMQRRLTATTHHSIVVTKEMTEMVAVIRDNMANFDDFYRPIRNYFYWEPHCYDIPLCWSFRSAFDALDGVDRLTDRMQELVPIMDTMDGLQANLVAQIPRQIEIMEQAQTLTLSMTSTMEGGLSTLDDTNMDATAMGQAFDEARDDDSFYLPADVFENPDFKQAMASFLSPDGHSARFIISHKGDPATPEAVARISEIRTAAEEALKSTPLKDAQIYIAGTASMFKDFQDGSKYDLLIAGIGALCLILIIMLVITRSIIAALVIVGTVALSLGSSFGMAVLIWQYILGIELHWMVLPMSVIVLLAVGSDYNLLLVSRIKEEIAAGINTGIIRAMGGTGKVVTNAGLVFAFTMGSMVFSDLRIIGQVGTTICLGLLFDTLVVRSFMTPAIAALLGRWFWWPLNIRPRPASQMLRPYGPRPAVRELLSTPIN
jgi:RND superfamily putative drug exporter